MTDPAVLQARLDEAELALHELVTQRRPVKVDVGEGTAVTYAPGQAGA